MKRVFLTAAGIIALINSHAQISTDSTGFKSRKLQVEEINLVSSYYQQDGNNASVTGGIGTEKLNDISNIFEVVLTKYDKKLRLHTLGLEVGIDHYTSASSDMIDLKANSSASHADTRVYPSINWSMENASKGTTIGAGLYASHEFDYQSFGGNVSFAKKTPNKMGEFTVKFQTFIDQVSLILPVELRTFGNHRGDDYPTTPRNTFGLALGYSQIVNKRLQLMLMTDIVKQDGYLSLPFHRVYFSDSSVHQENMPASRFKVPIGFRANYFLADGFIIKTYYRFYKDDWGIMSQTANIEVPIKITPFLSVSPFYRFYSQTASKYFAPYRTHTAEDQYYTSNYDESKFNSNFLGAGIRIAPPKGILGQQHFSMVEFRYGHYQKTVGLNANVISMNLKFK